MEALESPHSEYRSRGFAPFSVNVGQDRNTAANYIAKSKITYPILLDPASSAAEIYGIPGIPMSFVIDRKGIVRYRILGEISKKGLEKVLIELISK